MPFTRDDIDLLCGVLSGVIRDYVSARLDPELQSIATRLEAIESRPRLRNAGIYRDGSSYEIDAVVQHSGKNWVCERPTSSRPSTDDSGWRMMGKKDLL